MVIIKKYPHFCLQTETVFSKLKKKKKYYNKGENNKRKLI